MGTVRGILGISSLRLMASIVADFVRSRVDADTSLTHCGLAYGLITYFVMNWLVVPLRFGTPLPPKPLSIATQLFAHIVLVGLEPTRVSHLALTYCADSCE